MSEDYNGWSNRETWAVALHINNDEGFLETVKEIVNKKTEFEIEKDDALRDYIDDIIEDYYEALEDGDINKEVQFLIRDVGSLWRVNWTELVKSFQDVKE